MASDVSKAQKITAEELLAADSRIPQLLCFAVQAAAFNLTRAANAVGLINVAGNVNRRFSGKGICVQPVGSHSSSRNYTCTSVNNNGTIEYYPDDLMVIGGMAIALYDYVISHITPKRKLPKLRNSLTKNTSDIDMVWWPRTLLNNKVITINSPAIQELCDKFIEKIKLEITSTFHDNKDVNALLLKNMKKIANATSFTTDVHMKETPPIFGAKHICIYFMITYGDDTTDTLEMCDIAIHDNASSQLNPSGQLQVMTTDPVYSKPVTEIRRLAVNPPLYINVPIIQKLVEQQLFSLENLLHKYNMLKMYDHTRKDELQAIINKCIINYRRLFYIRAILFETTIIPDTLNDYKSELFVEFGISEHDVNRIIAKINTELYRIILQIYYSNNELYQQIDEAKIDLEKKYSAQRQYLAYQQYLAQQQLAQRQYMMQLQSHTSSRQGNKVPSSGHIPAPTVKSKGGPSSHNKKSPQGTPSSRKSPPKKGGPSSRSKSPPKKGGRHTRRYTQRKRKTAKRH